jgi:hypothetical protein
MNCVTCHCVIEPWVVHAGRKGVKTTVIVSGTLQLFMAGDSLCKKYVVILPTPYTAVYFVAVSWKTSKEKYISLYSNYFNIYPTRCNFTQLILSGNCSTCFGWYHHPSSGAQTIESTASGTCHTVTATCRNRGRVGTGLSLPWVVYRFGWDCSLIQTCTPNSHLYRVTYTRCRIYIINSPDDGHMTVRNM